MKDCATSHRKENASGWIRTFWEARNLSATVLISFLACGAERVNDFETGGVRV